MLDPSKFKNATIVKSSIDALAKVVVAFWGRKDAVSDNVADVLFEAHPFVGELHTAVMKRLKERGLLK